LDLAGTATFLANLARDLRVRLQRESASPKIDDLDREMSNAVNAVADDHASRRLVPYLDRDDLLRIDHERERLAAFGKVR
jgi:hypothetical protein